MPGGDGTGPMGTGAMTGREAGRCAGFHAPGLANWEWGSGRGPAFGRGRRAWSLAFGGGRGWRNRFFATGLPGWARGGFASGTADQTAESDAGGDAERRLLARRAEALQTELDRIERRLSELQDPPSTNREP
jgi:hypothetical protein